MTDTPPAIHMVVREPFGLYQRGDVVPAGAALTEEEQAMCTRAAAPVAEPPHADHQDEER